jgi:DNA-binding IclR family transcriptional regulator
MPCISGSTWTASASGPTASGVQRDLLFHSPATILAAAQLLAEPAEVRDRGWASVNEELEVGLDAVAAPVRDANCQVIAALSVSGPSCRLAEEKFSEVAEDAIAARTRSAGAWAG